MTFIGQSTRRVEDERFLTGRGTFVEDVNLPGQMFAYVVRSPHAHAVIEGIDISRVTGASVFIYADIADLGLLPCATAVATVAPMLVPPRPALANARVRHVGDPVAFVVAETRAAARDTAERVVVEYRPLPSVVDGAAALWHRARRCCGTGFPAICHSASKKAIPTPFAPPWRTRRISSSSI